ncbi:hypothetical protein DQ384_27090 [Sphaerisporangium album]|uniref:Uncharacterized protein n=2 Tax=Sphaerisporangium album TaxID=509200 RepID=A0A367FAG9_9ACTN|nr:hypothetical protein DQ384_27090 [Sphaerisporangium album]
MPAMASGTATVFKLIVASLALTGAYFGAVAAQNGGRPGTAAGEAPVRTVVLSSRAMPVQDAHVPEPGTVSVGLSGTGDDCRSVYHAQSVIDPGPAGDPVVYDWRLARWSPSTRTWKTYLFSGPAGFMGARRTVEWYPHVVGNPGWYRVELSVRDGVEDGAALARVVSERFRVGC